MNAEHLLPWVLGGDEPGDDVLEVGPGGSSAVACSTMPHQIPDPADQDRVLGEMARVLRPGGLLPGTDGEVTAPRRASHVFTPIDPSGLPDRLRATGLAEVPVDGDGSGPAAEFPRRGRGRLRACRPR